MPRLNLRQTLSESVEPPANAVLVASALVAAGRIVGSGHWRCSISGRGLGDRLVLKLGAHSSLGFSPVKDVEAEGRPQPGVLIPSRTPGPQG